MSVLCKSSVRSFDLCHFLANEASRGCCGKSILLTLYKVRLTSGRNPHLLSRLIGQYERNFVVRAETSSSVSLTSPLVGASAGTSAETLPDLQLTSSPVALSNGTYDETSVGQQAPSTSSSNCTNVTSGVRRHRQPLNRKYFRVCKSPEGRWVVRVNMVYIATFKALDEAALWADRVASAYPANCRRPLNFPERDYASDPWVAELAALGSLHKAGEAVRRQQLHTRGSFKHVNQRKDGMYEVQVHLRGVKYYVGYFQCARAAARAADLVLTRFHGEKALLNFPQLAAEYMSELRDYEHVQEHDQFVALLRANNRAAKRAAELERSIGVSWNKREGAFVAFTRLKQRLFHLGYFKDVVEAQRMADRAVLWFGKDRKRMNHHPSDYEADELLQQCKAAGMTDEQFLKACQLYARFVTHGIPGADPPAAEDPSGGPPA